MANSTQYTKALAGVTKLDTNEDGGKIRIAYGDFTFANTAVGSVNMFKLPNGARLISGRVHGAGIGSNVTLSVGYAAYVKPDGTAVNAATAGYKALAAANGVVDVDILATVALGEDSVVDTTTEGLVVTATTAAAAATGKISVKILYSYN
tara:strand:- start:1225 stop:1674 length:450 start_codon:yes stop_codon:yes gene_type:complete